jgi:serine-type D-Ala-D-Ala carboxypeptidase/endopeptidase (penicillin-binding protein 4)
MPRARWWVVGALALVTLTVLLLDAAGVIFEAEPSTAPPPPLVLPQGADAEAAVAAPFEPTGSRLDKQVVAEVRRQLDAEGLGSSVHAQVVPLGLPSGAARPALDLDADAPAAPASTLKLWTAIAVLDAFPAEARLRTSVVWDEGEGRLVLVGGGDTTLTTEQVPGTPSLERLATTTARRLSRLGADQVRLAYDDSLFTGPSVSPQWEDIYVTSGVIAPVSALMADQGRVTVDGDARYPDPALGAANAFSDLLEEDGIDVRGTVRESTAPTDEPLTSVTSEPVLDLVERMLRDSDNQLAESLGRLAAAEQGGPASFRGAAQALLDAAQQRGAVTDGAVVHDASGLSRQDRMPAVATVEALLAAATEPALAPVLSGLPVAGFDGTLADRFTTRSSKDAAGLVRAKTGTLTGISAEAGVATTCGGDLVAYAFVADDVVDTLAARVSLDDAAAALTSCPARG